MMTASQLWPVRRDSADWVAGFQRGYAEALLDVGALADGAMSAADVLMLVADALANPIGKAARRAEAFPD